jgi:hypothetical protein
MPKTNTTRFVKFGHGAQPIQRRTKLDAMHDKLCCTIPARRNILYWAFWRDVHLLADLVQGVEDCWTVADLNHKFFQLIAPAFSKHLLTRVTR